MHTSDGEQLGAVEEAGTEQDKECAGCASDTKMSEGWIMASSAVTEISDKDYRSFCWPCYALEEISDGKPVK